jgi:Right handed beta helix region
MKAALVSLILLLAAAPLLADSADMRIDSFSPGTLERAGFFFYGNIFIRNGGPDTARNVVVTTTVENWPEVQHPCPGGRCVIGDVKTDDYFPIVPRIAQPLPIRDFTFTITVTVSSDTPDPNPSNNTVTRSIRVTTAPHLTLLISTLPLIDPGEPFDLSLRVSNYGLDYATAHDLVITLDLPDGVEAASLPEGCTALGRQVVCRLESLAPGTYNESSTTFRLRLDAPPRYEGGEILFRATLKAREESISPPDAMTANAKAFLYRTFFVTTTADDGLGSLRAAAAGAAALCPGTQACKIAFNIPGEERWQTIRLQSPLPPIRARLLVIDGATQSEFSGVKNPDGPPVEISGGGTVNGDGLTLVSLSSGTIANLTINGFRGNAIALDGGGNVGISGNFIGTDPTGSFAVPNYRGIGIATSLAAFYLPRISRNVISGNERSGIFALRGVYEVSRNRIGLAAHADEPLPNGGSGIYVGQDMWRMEIAENAIAFNREMGIAVHPLADAVWLQRNLVWSNGGLAIDRGLDGQSTAAPTITSAVYDPATNRTIVNVHGPMLAAFNVFASDAPGDARRPLGDFWVAPVSPGTLRLEIKIAGDLRGQWITATTTEAIGHPAQDVYQLARTSEVSNSVLVE